jgi:hypothetical protein
VFFVKKFFVKRALATALNAKRELLLPNPEQPQSFQLVLDDRQGLEVENYLSVLKTHFKVESVTVFVVSGKKTPTLSADKQVLFFSPASVSWLGKINDESLKEQLEKPINLSLDLRKHQNLLGDFLLASLASNFKVNFGETGVADLSLKLDKTVDLTIRIVELKKYLIKLNGK